MASCSSLHRRHGISCRIGCKWSHEAQPNSRFLIAVRCQDVTSPSVHLACVFLPLLRALVALQFVSSGWAQLPTLSVKAWMRVLKNMLKSHLYTYIYTYMRFIYRWGIYVCFHFSWIRMDFKTYPNASLNRGPRAPCCLQSPCQHTHSGLGTVSGI